MPTTLTDPLVAFPDALLVSLSCSGTSLSPGEDRSLLSLFFLLFSPVLDDELELFFFALIGCDVALLLGKEAVFATDTVTGCDLGAPGDGSVNEIWFSGWMRVFLMRSMDFLWMLECL